VSTALQDNFIDLVDCLLGPTGGFKLSLDYGANFEAYNLLLEGLILMIYAKQLNDKAVQGRYWQPQIGRHHFSAKNR